MTPISWYETLEGKLAMCLAVLLIVVAGFMAISQQPSQGAAAVDAQVTSTAHNPGTSNNASTQYVAPLNPDDVPQPIGTPPLETHPLDDVTLSSQSHGNESDSDALSSQKTPEKSGPDKTTSASSRHKRSFLDFLLR